MDDSLDFRKISSWPPRTFAAESFCESVLVVECTLQPRRRRMDSWVVSQISFWFTVRKVNPAQIVDQMIELFLDIVVPGRGAGETNWMMKGFRTLERGAERTQREMDIRSDLRRWDNDFPELHHELLVRWIAGAVVSVAVTSVYNALKPQPAARSRKY
eukprot:Nitzschia sp. Nitz4//scaffold30_size153850//65137//65998//NITZ4_002775-RB/size153850-exonerate_est2genome-gene-0.20-mRNA-1//-1//CDS//3329547255//3895//frame0